MISRSANERCSTTPSLISLDHGRPVRSPSQPVISSPPTHRIFGGLCSAGHDARAAALISDRSGWVITHGEPNAANMLWSANGDLFLIDWDTVAIGPRERDLWLPDELAGGADWSGYPVAADTGQSRSSRTLFSPIERGGI